MKKKTLVFTAIAVFSIAAQKANAQITSTDSGYYLNPCSETIFIHRNTEGTDLAKDHSTDIDARAIKNFSKEFPQVKNESWNKAFDGGYIATFDDHSSKTRVAYDTKGRFNHAISYYGEKNLPHDVWNTVKSSYYDYEILGVAQVGVTNETVYIVYMQNETQKKTIRVNNGDIEEMKSFKRG